MKVESSSDSCHKKRKLCQIVRHAQIAGTEKHVCLLAKNLDKDKFIIHACVFEHGDLVGELRSEGIDVTVIPGSHSVFHFLRLMYFFVRERFDLVHCHSGGYACLAAKLAGVRRIIYTKHGIGFTADELRQRTFMRRLRDRLVDLCVTRYIALTRYDKYVMNRVLRISPLKVNIIHNGIDPSFGNKIGSSRKKGYPTIGTIGRLTRQKGISYLIESIPIIAEKYRDIRLIIAGSGEEESALKNMADSLGVGKRVEFLGYVANPAAVIKGMDVFVLPSVWEGFPYVLLEAMLLKKPIVATDIFGVNEIIRHNQSGVLIEPRNSRDIARAVISLLSNKTMTIRIGKTAHGIVMKHFTVGKTVSRITELYASVL